MRKKLSKGFTVVESLVAISILVLAVTGATAAIQSGISSYIYSKDQVTAFYLAQEGFEQLRNIRDENSLESAHWLSGISQLSTDPCFFGQICRVSPVETTLATRCTGTCPKLRKDTVDGFFGYNSSWPESIFRREIVLESINSNEVAVTVTIYWNKGVVPRKFVVRENMLNWQADPI